MIKNNNTQKTWFKKYCPKRVVVAQKVSGATLDSQHFAKIFILSLKFTFSPYALDNILGIFSQVRKNAEHVF